MMNPDATHFGQVRIVRLRRSVSELRESCRSEGTPRIQAAWDDAEQWIDPIFTASAAPDVKTAAQVLLAARNPDGSTILPAHVLEMLTALATDR
ncbi:hypothetical protein SAMN05444339_10228 [Loktanella atrilutea]|uniref:Uncharacterized protein n=1 Tax=Loktanella atrilutea TaxID=366533 RepID=A0A1M4W8K8_LOKAT|nr:hypothetical protein [Loktanella atrilutea]SHE77591.1 hypothetical protein SAMN05444339_10228 [Loktanella atrilutea]